MLEVDGILPSPLTPLVLPPPVTEPVCEMQTPALFTMAQSSPQPQSVDTTMSARVNPLPSPATSSSSSGELRLYIDSDGNSPSLNRGPTSSSQELLLQGDQPPAPISSIAPPNIVTVPHSSQSHLPSWANEVEQSGDSTPDTVVPNWAASGRIRGPQPRSQPLVYPPPVFSTPSPPTPSTRIFTTVRARHTSSYAATVVCTTTVRPTYLQEKLPVHGPITKETTSCHTTRDLPCPLSIKSTWPITGEIRPELFARLRAITLPGTGKSNCADTRHPSPLSRAYFPLTRVYKPPWN